MVSPQIPNRAWLRAAFILEGAGELLLSVDFMLLGALVYAMAHGALPLHPPVGLIVAVVAVTAVGLPATLAAPALRIKAYRAAAPRHPQKAR